MPRPISKVAPEWWDYTTLDAELLADAARLTPDDLAQLSRPGFKVTIYDTLEEFYVRQAKGAAIPLGRVGEAADVGDLIAFLCSTRGSYISGVAINMDGGLSAVV